MDCGRCGGTGRLTIRLGRPGHPPHTPYRGPWCVYPEQDCPVCLGLGMAPSKRKPKADGLVVLHDVRSWLSTDDMMKEAGID